MKVTIQMFARARELAGAPSVQIDLLESARVRDLRHALCHRFPAMQGLVARSAVAVDQTLVDDEARLHAAQEIALLPPVSGG